jgi:hypothetical protein
MKMKTKLLVLSAIFILATFTLQAQMGFGILGGLNLQNLNGKDSNGDKLTNDMIIGFHAGINIQIPIVPQFYFQPGLLFTTKGAKNTNGTSIKLSYVELPLNLVYKAQVGNGKFMLGFGPYLGFAIGGKVKPESGSATDIEFKKVVETSDPSSVTYLKAFDAGGNIFAGYELAGGIFFQLNTQFGMLKINPEDRRISSDKSSVKNTGFGLSVGYRF